MNLPTRMLFGASRWVSSRSRDCAHDRDQIARAIYSARRWPLLLHGAGLRAKGPVGPDGSLSAWARSAGRSTTKGHCRDLRALGNPAPDSERQPGSADAVRLLRISRTHLPAVLSRTGLTDAGEAGR